LTFLFFYVIIFAIGKGTIMQKEVEVLPNFAFMGSVPSNFVSMARMQGHLITTFRVVDKMSARRHAEKCDAVFILQEGLEDFLTGKRCAVFRMGIHIPKSEKAFQTFVELGDYGAYYRLNKVMSASEIKELLGEGNVSELRNAATNRSLVLA